jgi:adenylate kinase
MKPKLVLIAGISGTGKTSLCQKISNMLGWQHLRIHPYVLDLAKKKNIENPSDIWNSLLLESIPYFIADIQRYSRCCTDHHLAVQPKYDTSYALGLDTKEDLNEPYEKSLCNEVLSLKDWGDVHVYPILLESTTEEILVRRARLSNIKKPRSLNPESINKEREFERKYFLDACSSLAKNNECTELILPNEEGRFMESFKRTVKHIS